MSEKAADSNIQLPDDCWELIFERFGQIDIISLVCKHFLSITNSLKYCLTISDPNILLKCNVSNLFRRFNQLSYIDINCVMSEQDFNNILICIARSGLDLQELYIRKKQPKIGVEGFRELGSKLKNFKILRCMNSILDTDLDMIANAIPQLEKLDIRSDICHPVVVTDDGIEALASRLKNIRNIDIFKRNGYLSDRSLIALSLNCKLLTKIVVHMCNVTEHGIGFALRHCQNLKSLKIWGLKESSRNFDLFSLENSISYATSLCKLDIRALDISDALLFSIAKARLPLKKLALFLCEGFTYSGLSFLLQECQFLDELKLEYVEFLTDQMMNDLSTFLHNVTCIKLKSCSKLTGATFFILTRNCPFLNELVLTGLDGVSGRACNFGSELKQNFNITTLELSLVPKCDESIKLFGLVCPNLQYLDIHLYQEILEEGIEEILKSCPDLTYLKMGYCKENKILGNEMSELKLEVLHLAEVDDEGMALIGIRCPNLLELDLGMLSGFTEKGVKEVVEKCVNLREIYLRGWYQVSFDFVRWMMSARPSLRKIFSHYKFSEEEKGTCTWIMVVRFTICSY